MVTPVRKVLLLCQEWIGNFFVAIHGTEKGDCWTTKDNQTEGACCLFGFGLEDFLDVIEDEVQELVETLQDAGHFSPAGKLDPDFFVHVSREVQDRLAFWLVHRWLWSLRAMVLATAPRRVSRPTATLTSSRRTTSSSICHG